MRPAWRVGSRAEGGALHSVGVRSAGARTPRFPPRNPARWLLDLEHPGLFSSCSGGKTYFVVRNPFGKISFSTELREAQELGCECVPHFKRKSCCKLESSKIGVAPSIHL